MYANWANYCVIICHINDRPWLTIAQVLLYDTNEKKNKKYQNIPGILKEKRMNSEKIHSTLSDGWLTWAIKIYFRHITRTWGEDGERECDTEIPCKSHMKIIFLQYIFMNSISINHFRKWQDKDNLSLSSMQNPFTPSHCKHIPNSTCMYSVSRAKHTSHTRATQKAKQTQKEWK